MDYQDALAMLEIADELNTEQIFSLVNFFWKILPISPKRKRVYPFLSIEIRSLQFDYFEYFQMRKTRALLVQNYFKFDSEQRVFILELIYILSDAQEIGKYEAWLLEILEKEAVPADSILIRILLKSDSQKAYQIIFTRYLEHVSLDSRRKNLSVFSCSNFYRFFLFEKLIENPQKDFIADYIRQDFLLITEPKMLEIVKEWLNCNPETWDSHLKELAATFVSQVSPQILCEFSGIWISAIESEDSDVFQVGVKALLFSYHSENHRILAELLADQVRIKDKQRDFLNVLQYLRFFEFRAFWRIAYLSEHQYLHQAALRVLAYKIYYDGNLMCFIPKFYDNDPDFWLKLWKESPDFAVRLNGACQLLLAEPDNIEAKEWLLAQMQTQSYKPLNKIWETFREGTSETFQLELALQQLTSPRQMLRELAAKQLRLFKDVKPSQPELLAGLKDSALPVQIEVARTLAAKFPDSAPELRAWIQTQLDSGPDYAKAWALKLIKKLELKGFRACLENQSFLFNPRLKRQREKTLQVLMHSL